MLVLLLVFGTALIWHFVETAEARPVSGTISAKLGAFTGAGGSQSNNIKASLDLAHTDLDSVIASTSNSGQALPSGKSLFDIIGETYTDDGGGDHLDDVATHLDIILAGTAPSYYRPNEATYYGYFTVEPGAFDTTGTWSTVASHEVITVTGAVRIRMLIECTTTLTDAGNTSTLALGTEGATTTWIGSTSAGGSGTANQLDATDVWVDTSPEELETVGYATAVLDFIVVGGKDVGYTIGSQALTGGVLVFHVWWEPLDSTGLCAAGAGGPL